MFHSSKAFQLTNVMTSAGQFFVLHLYACTKHEWYKMMDPIKKLWTKNISELNANMDDISSVNIFDSVVSKYIYYHIREGDSF